MSPRPNGPMSEEHKAALAAGRAQGLAVKNYLEGLESHKPRRGRPRTPEMIEQQILMVDVQLSDAPPLDRLKLIQRRIDLERALEELKEPQVDLTALEAAFVEAAAAYSKSQGISYEAWRKFGVDPEVLKRAGITR